MLYTELFSQEDLIDAIGEGLIRVTQNDTGLRLLTYTDKAMRTPGAWRNPAVRHCRGLIIDGWEIVARPWAKFFNHGQIEAGVPRMDAPVEVTDKLDGSLGIIYWDGDQWAVATRGSFASEQALHATAALHAQRLLGDCPRAFTPLVEIIYPENRIVCDYGATDTLALLGGVQIGTGDYVGPMEAAVLIGWRGAITRVMPHKTLREALAAKPRPGKEGVVVRYLDEPRMVKIKQDDYIELHRIVTGLSEKTIWRRMLDGMSVEQQLEGVPDELHAWVGGVYNRIWAQAEGIYHEAQTAHDRALWPLLGNFSRRAYAEQAIGYRYSHLMFKLLDGQDITTECLKLAEPSGHTAPIYTDPKEAA